MCYVVLIFQTISISMLLRYCHHQIFVFIGKSKLFYVKAVPKFYSYIVILVVLQIRSASNREVCWSKWSGDEALISRKSRKEKNCVTGIPNREFKILGWLWWRRCHLEFEFMFFQSSSLLFQLAYFVKCKRSLLELNSYELFPSSEKER